LVVRDQFCLISFGYRTGAKPVFARRYHARDGIVHFLEQRSNKKSKNIIT
jgi:hypothetical protein